MAGHAAGEGRSLAQELEARGRIEVGEAARIAAGILAALGAAHSAGIIHRDVKPGNIMLADDGSVLLSDFGIAKHHADTAQTSTSKLVGSLPYMAPERLKGQDLPAGDLFALGATLYEATEGVSPFHRDTPIAVMGAVALEQPTPPQNAGALGPLTLGLLDKDPDRRPTALNALRALAAPTAAAPGNAQAPQSTPTATGWPPPAPPTAIRPTAIPGTIPLPDPGSAPTPQSAMTSLASETPCHSDTRRNPAYLWIGGIVAACVIGVLIYALGVSNGSPSGNGTQGAGAGATTSSTSSGTGNGTGTSQGSSNPTASQRQTSQATTGGSNPGTALEGQWSGNIPGYENGAYLGNAQIALDVTGAAEGQSVGTVHVVNAIADCTGDLTLTSAPSNSTESFSAQITSGNCVNQTLTPTPSGASSLDINMTPNGTAGALNLRGTLTRE